MAQTAYIHIPFCAHKCDFCDFAAFAGVDDLMNDYSDVVVREISQRLSRSPNNSPLKSVHYGGGTPGYVDPAELKRVQSAIAAIVGIEEGAEITLETTPHAISKDKAKAWLDMGFNRLSIGIQSFNDSELTAMGRDHSGCQALKGIETAVEAGFKNIGLDLIYGLPEQTLQSWQETLGTALSLDLPHLSAYGLTIANHSPLLNKYPKNCNSYPGEDIYVAMYEQLITMCSQAGLVQYEISNFARQGYQSRHNLTYWANEEYLGFGVSAHRYVHGARSSNFRSLRRYMRDFLADETFEQIDEKTRAKEAIFLGLRLRDGINLAEFRSKYGLDIEEVLKTKLRKLADGGFLTVEDGRLKLSQEGVLVSNLVIAELV
jgi:oxygen-independent coproporphyrinogen-3 oxidase